MTDSFRGKLKKLNQLGYHISRWIPIDQDLPPHGDTVLVITEKEFQAEDPPCPALATRVVLGEDQWEWIWIDGINGNQVVTHWCSIPTPPWQPTRGVNND